MALKWDCPLRATEGDRSMFSACNSNGMDDQSAEKWTSPQRSANGYTTFK